MDLPVKGVSSDELVSTRLRKLFDKRGFRRIRVNKFEDYALYIEYKNFLKSENIITFMDANGKLLALKPDITLSIVKNMPEKELTALEKLYYVDEVIRLTKETREYKVCNQIGMEIIGKTDSFSNIEAVQLALLSLELISKDFVLDISHLGFLSGLLEQADIPAHLKHQVMDGIHRCSRHDVAAALDAACACEEFKNRVLSLSCLRGNFFELLPKVKELINCRQMQEAYDELKHLGESFKDTNLGKRMNLDFSVVNDLDYYNGLIFLGYVKGVPKVALTGGRYDNLMRKMGKNNSAIGFAVSLDDFSTYLNTGKKFDFDILITYNENSDYARLLAIAGDMAANGMSVRLENERLDLESAGFTWGKRYNFADNRIREED
ncbi:MAG: ATP phosphoribosyltransferase regulatory subunit [Oscillospiraceae bacterium]|nr:ATP phosphoribosyltransferase regulatory subunit [Oscillospiraceae bacterium]